MLITYSKPKRSFFMYTFVLFLIHISNNIIRYNIVHINKMDII